MNLGEMTTMNAKKLAPLAEPTAEDDQELKSGIRSTRDLAESLGLCDDAEPPWAGEPPMPLLPHNPEEYQEPRPAAAHPPHAEVLEAVAGESLGNGLAERLF